MHITKNDSCCVQQKNEPPRLYTMFWVLRVVKRLEKLEGFGCKELQMSSICFSEAFYASNSSLTSTYVALGQTGCFWWLS